MSRLILTIITIALFALRGECVMDARMFMYDHLGIEDGMLSQRVHSIVEDSNGDIWISTKNRVSRYNGRTLLNYQLNPDAIYSSAGGRVIKLMTMNNGDVVAYDNNGNIFIYDSALDSFIKYAEEFTLQFSKFYSSAGWIILNDIVNDASGRFWISTSRGFMIYDNVTKTIQHILTEHYINSILMCNNDAIVCSTSGAFVIDVTSHKAVCKISDANVLTSYYDKEKHMLWLGTFNSGILAFDQRNWKPVPSAVSASVPHTPVRAIEVLNDSVLMFGVDGGGVYASKRDGNLGRALFTADEQTGGVLHGNGIYDILRDRQGNVWIGSYTGGVDIAFPTGRIVEEIRHKKHDSQSLINDGVNDILENGANLLFATDRGVSILDRATNQWRHLLHGKVALTLSRGQDGCVYVGTYGNGVFKISPNGAVSESYNVKSGNLVTDYVYSLWLDRHRNMWIGCLDRQLLQVSASGTRSYDVDGVRCITDAPDGRVAVGTANGIFLIDAESGRYDHILQQEATEGKDINCYILSILFCDNKCWLATDGGGVYIYDLTTKALSSLTTNEGLPSNSIGSLALDTFGRIVAATDCGLAIIDPRTRNVLNLNFISGLNREYNRTSVESLANGMIVFGSNNGAVMVNTAPIDKLDYIAPLRFVNIVVKDDAVTMSDTAKRDLHRMLVDGKIGLSHNQSTFEVTFESIFYKYCSDILYQYKLEGFNDEWSKPSTESMVSFTNLPAGSYTLKVRSISNNDGRIIDSRELAIAVAEPWWNTAIAWVIYYALLITLGVLILINYRNRLERRYFNEKINFFMNAAHDIRTPLSLILAPLSDIAADSTLSKQNRRYLDIARANGNKLFGLISELLDFQKADIRGEQLKMTPIAVKDLVSGEVEKFQLLASEKHIDLKAVNNLSADRYVLMDRFLAGKLFEHLLSNAIKYTPEHGKITVTARGEGKRVVITVADTGIGIPKSAHKNIFKSFYRAENAILTKETGTGIGLMLARRIMAMHGGTLAFESEEGQGTTFSITLNEYCPTQAEIEAQNIEQDNYDVDANCESSDKLLFVDDNSDLRDYIKITLGNDFNVVTVGSAEEALNYLSTGECDIVVSDVMMPGMSGEELCREIKGNKEWSWLPVVLLTAIADKDSMIEGLSSGADDYVTKPFDPAILKSKISAILANRRRMSEYYLKRVESLTASLAPSQNEWKPSGHEANAEIHMVEDAKPACETENTTEPLNPADEQFVCRATTIIMENIADSEFNIDALCREMAMSRTLFYGRLRTLTSQTPQDFIRTIRLQRAATLIRQGVSVTEVSELTGFANPKHFSTVFKKHFGTSPSKFT